jgi:DNA polymerase (family 10)
MPKTTAHSDIARMLFEFGYYNDMLGVAFKPRAFQLASESVTGLGGDVEAAWRRDGIKELKKLPGIGQGIASIIDEYFRTGKVKEYVAMKKKFPVDIWGLAQIEGLGPKKIYELYHKLKVKNVKDLEKAIKAKKIRTLPGFGEQSEDKIARGLGLMQRSSGRKLLAYVQPTANRIVEALSKVEGVKHCSYAGSLRRKQETVGDIDLIATLNHSSMTMAGTTEAKRIMDAFVAFPQIETVLERGKTRALVRLKNGMDCDLRVVPDEVYGATLQYFTGDKRHNVLLRQQALSKGLTLNEYGLFKLSKKTAETKTVRAHGKLIACRTEEDVYRALGMDTPPPEIRTGGDEIDAARHHALPELIPYGSVKGDLQVQTNWTDGEASIEEMVEAAKKKKLSYFAVTDHTKALAFIHGLDDKGILKQGKAIDVLNKKLRNFRVLKGTECDILKDGSLDLSDASLKTLDWVGISVHSAFRLSRAEQTARVIKAMSNPNVDCLFHPTARLVTKREPIDLDMDEVMAAAKKYRVALEIDCFPERSDLNDLHTRMAVKAGVMLVIDTDAHGPSHFGFMPLGEAIARRGWAEKKHVLNTKSVKDLLAYLNKKRKRG